MLPILVIAFAIVVSTAIAYGVCDTAKEKRSYSKGWAIAMAIIGVFFWMIILASSYGTYLDDRAFFSATKEQYRSALTVYTDHATIDIKSAALTDFKYQGYQGHVSDFVRTLRRQVTRYNESIIQKRVMKENILFKYMIVAPDDDMVPINLLED